MILYLMFHLLFIPPVKGDRAGFYNNYNLSDGIFNLRISRAKNSSHLAVAISTVLSYTYEYMEYLIIYNSMHELWKDNIRNETALSYFKLFIRVWIETKSNLSPSLKNSPPELLVLKASFFVWQFASILKHYLAPENVITGIIFFITATNSF